MSTTGTFWVSAGAQREMIKKTNPKLSYKLQYEFDGLPKKIKALEKEIADIEETLSDPTMFKRDADAFTRLSRRLVMAGKDRDAMEHRWLELSEMG